MSARPVRLRERAAVDIDQAVDYYLAEADTVRPLARFPYLVFYVVGDELVDVWRVLPTRRDIPTAMGDQVGT